MKNINQIQNTWVPSDEDWEIMYQEYLAEEAERNKEQRQMELDLGDYLPQYKREIRDLELALAEYLKERKESLYELYQSKNALKKSWFELRRAA